MLDGRDKFVFKRALVESSLTAPKFDIRTVEREIRFRKQYVLPRIDQCGKNVQQGVGTTHGHANVGFIQTGTARSPGFGDSFAQCGQSCCCSVLVVSVQHGIVECIDSNKRGLEIGLTKAKGNDIITSHIEHFPHTCRLNRQCAVRKAGHIRPEQPLALKRFERSIEQSVPLCSPKRVVLVLPIFASIRLRLVKTGSLLREFQLQQSHLHRLASLCLGGT